MHGIPWLQSHAPLLPSTVENFEPALESVLDSSLPLGASDANHRLGANTVSRDSASSENPLSSLQHSSPHNSLVEISLSSQTEYRSRQQIREGLRQENRQLQELVARWKRAYEILEEELSGTDRLHEHLEPFLEQKRTLLTELSKLQNDNSALREENIALRERNTCLVEYCSEVSEHTSRLEEILLQARSQMPSQF